MAENDAPQLYQIVRELTTRADLPMPRLYVIPSDQPNAFATGRSPKQVGGRRHRRDHEAALRGRAAWRDLPRACPRPATGTSSRSRSPPRSAAAITWIAYMMLWFGGDDDSPLSLVANLALLLLAPIAASLIQLAISRQREYSADATGAQICGNPESLASALLRLEEGAKAIPMQVNQADRAALHREAVLGRRDREPVLHPPADRGARPPPAPDAPGAAASDAARPGSAT